jgi:hypothetical protein
VVSFSQSTQRAAERNEGSEICAPGTRIPVSYPARSRDLTYRITFDERDENGKQRSVVRLITGADAVNLDAPDVIVAQGTTGETVTT